MYSQRIRSCTLERTSISSFVKRVDFTYRLISATSLSVLLPRFVMDTSVAPRLFAILAAATTRLVSPDMDSAITRSSSPSCLALMFISVLSS